MGMFAATEIGSQTWPTKQRCHLLVTARFTTTCRCNLPAHNVVTWSCESKYDSSCSVHLQFVCVCAYEHAFGAVVTKALVEGFVQAILDIVICVTIIVIVITLIIIDDTSSK